MYATIIPNVRNGKIVSYTSVRRQPSREKVNECTKLYYQLLAEERKAANLPPPPPPAGTEQSIKALALALAN